jgi:rhodanese-related sulfurtransferase
MTQMKQYIIDVREKHEHLLEYLNRQEVINIPLSSFQTELEKINALGRDAEIIVFCRSGQRAALAKQILESRGFNNVTNGIDEANVRNLIR